MTFAKNVTSISDFSQLDDVVYHLTEIQYHSQNFLSSLGEAEVHLNKLQMHFEELQNLKTEALHV
jgi:hypothetical protein